MYPGACRTQNGYFPQRWLSGHRALLPAIRHVGYLPEVREWVEVPFCIAVLSLMIDSAQHLGAADTGSSVDNRDELQDLDDLDRDLSEVSNWLLRNAE